MSTLPDRVLFGAAYYHEYMPHDRLKADLDLMAAAGFSVIRVGESVWSTWEPAEGVFDLDWLAPAVDEAHARGIAVVLGTPTYAVPPWLRRKYPETTAQRRTGQPIPYGHRQDVDITDPAFRYLAERVVRRIVARYADHPGVIGYQVDNEPGNELLHNPAVFAGFVDELRARYGDVETLNDAWGLTYWSHRIGHWSELWTPDGNTVPSYDLAWRRYQARLTTEFVAWQAGIVRELAREDQFVTTCLALGRPAVDAVRLAASLDVTATNLYYPMQDALTMPRPPEPRIGGQPEWLEAAGPWLPFFQADVSRGVRQEPFLVTETSAATIGESYANYPAYDGQWRLVAWALVARGARMIEYWHWHTLHYGHETYWGGVLGHDLLPGRCYYEIARIGAELSAAGDALIDLAPDAEAAILISPESRWAWQFQPPLAVEGGTAGDRRSYDRVLHAFYRGLFAAGLQVDVVAPTQLGGSAADLVARWPVLVVPALYIADDELLRQLRDYARQGGHLVVGFHSGYADEEARPRPDAMPAVLSDVAGVHYQEYSNLAAPVRVQPSPPLPPAAVPMHATGWADGLEADTATVLARYDHPHLRRWAAVTTNAAAAGRVTYVGTLPDHTLAEALARWVRATSLSPDAWAQRPASVTVTAARTSTGRRLRFVSNWSWEPVTMHSRGAVEDLLSGSSLDAGEDLALGPWDVRVLIERSKAPSKHVRRQEEERS